VWLPCTLLLQITAQSTQPMYAAPMHVASTPQAPMGIEGVLSLQAELERLAEELTTAQDARQAAAAQQERLSTALHAAKQQVV
jgi:hypothetical protein